MKHLPCIKQYVLGLQALEIYINDSLPQNSNHNL